MLFPGSYSPLCSVRAYSAGDTGGLYTAWLAVQGTLRLEFARHGSTTHTLTPNPPPALALTLALTPALALVLTVPPRPTVFAARRTITLGVSMAEMATPTALRLGVSALFH